MSGVTKAGYPFIVFLIGLLAIARPTFSAAEISLGWDNRAATMEQDTYAKRITISQAARLDEGSAIQIVKAHPSQKGASLGAYLAQKSSVPAIRELGWSATKSGHDWIVEYSMHVSGLTNATIYRWRVTPAHEVTPVNGHAMGVTLQPKVVRAQPKATPPAAWTRDATLVEASIEDWLQGSDADRLASAGLLLLPLVERLDPEAIPETRATFEGFARAGAEMMSDCMTRRGRTLAKPEAVMASAVARICYMEIR